MDEPRRPALDGFDKLVVDFGIAGITETEKDSGTGSGIG